MMHSLLQDLLVFLAFVGFAFAAPVTETNALEARLPPNPDPAKCIPPMVLCDRACCGTGSKCSSNGLCAPDVPKIGTIQVSHYTDAQGNQGMIAIHGAGFAGTADVLIQVYTSSTITDVYLNTNVPGPSWSLQTGIQDCTADGQSTGATDGNIAYVWAADNYLTNYYEREMDTPRVTIRAMANGGLCPKMRRMPIGVFPAIS